MKFLSLFSSSFMITFLWLLSVTCLAQKIPYGKNSFVNYKTDQGTFDVFVNGKQVLRDGYSEVLVNKNKVTSKDYVTRTTSRSSFRNAIGKGLLYKFKTIDKSGFGMVQSIFAYTDQDFFVIDVTVFGTDLSSNQMFPLKGELIGVNDFSTQTSLFVPFDNDTFISYQANLLTLKKENVSAEITSVYDNGSRKGYVVGTLNHNEWKTGLKTRMLNQSNLQLATECGYTNYDITRDKIEHGYLKGNSISSSKILFGYFDDWRNGMEIYAKTVRAVEKPIVANWNGPTPVGWNSWGVIQEKLSYEKATQVVDFFATNLKSFRIGNIAYIDLDSYWDNMLKGNDYTMLKKFADYCKSKGLKPGIYWAPFTDWGFHGGPQRKAPGSDYTFGEMWTKINDGFHDFDGARALDPTHPGTQKRINSVISHLKESGFEMIKIDFLGHAAVESTQFYDPKITTGMQSYRIGMEYLLKCLDNKMLVYAAISPSMASGKYVQVRRIACDAFKSIKDTKYTLNSVTNGWWQTYLYNYIDGDHVVLADESEAANVSRTLSAIVTGTLIVGDDFSVDGQWKARAEKLFQNEDLLNIIIDGKAFRPVDGDMGKGASNQYIKDLGKIKYVALFNFENSHATAKIDYSRLGIDESSIISIEDLVDHQIVNPENYHQKELGAAQATMLKINIK
ncbi:alpha-galactosidase [Pedobacter frigidisoli]|uniref:Alpha-galactosidase n=1 Tax=Pedobacter frigidisoli TaxID=2530455 RepID=A0A4R0P3A8_9SPHI|nr:alpha-galactosidase [Pedobacter frigidisoli]TCD08294.1 alpha-galactosidase [Pedobacter frigidisoli]